MRKYLFELETSLSFSNIQNENENQLVVGYNFLLNISNQTLAVGKLAT